MQNYVPEALNNTLYTIYNLDVDLHAVFKIVLIAEIIFIGLNFALNRHTLYFWF